MAAKLYFKYGAMGSSKTAQALITKFNYEERNMKVWFIKPSTDNRDGADVVKSRIGLEAKALPIASEENLYNLFKEKYADADAVIVDECQFLTPEQVDQLADITIDYDIAVLCFGLRTDAFTHFFPGAQRLMEIAESITEIKMVCDCGAKATINARFDENWNLVFEGDQLCIGGNDKYRSMCRKCWTKARREYFAKQNENKQ